MDFYANILVPTTVTFTCDELIRCKVCFICLLLLPSTPQPAPLPHKQHIYWTRSSFQHAVPSPPNGLVIPSAIVNRHVYKPIEIKVAMGSVVHFVCPPLAANEHYLIYKVSSEDYSKCSTEETRRRRATPFLRCSGSPESGLQPHRRTFQISELNPFGKGYKAGEEIHFITTSSGSPIGIDNMHDGACEKYQMRVKLTVQKAEHPEERYRSCLRILGVQPECCEPRNRLGDTCSPGQPGATSTTTYQAPSVVSHAGFFLSNGPPYSASSSIEVTLFNLALSTLISSVIRRLL